MRSSGKYVILFIVCTAAACSGPAPSLGGASPLDAPKSPSTWSPVATRSAAARPHAEPDLRLEVSLSPAAERLLAAREEEFIVAVRYFADAKPGVRTQLNGVGQVDLGTQEFELRQAGPMHLRAPNVTPAERQLMKAPMEININVFSNRRTSADNLLDCNFYQDYVDLARRDGMKIKCGLLSEAPPAPSN